MDAISLAEVVVKTLEKERTENQFELFWKKINEMKKNCASMTLLLREKRNHRRA